MAYQGHYNTYPYNSGYQRQAPLPPPPALLAHQQAAPRPPPLQTYQQTQYTMPSATNSEAPNSPGHETPTERAEAEKNYGRPDVPPLSKVLKNRAYMLKVFQQPRRARMCGFGDKDRRPISPPPCVQLCIYDTSVNPHVEIDYSKVEDLSRYVIMVDLACMDTLAERNLVTHPAASPSISTVTTSAYPPTFTSAPPSRMPMEDFALTSIPGYTSGEYGRSTQANGQSHYSNGMPGYGAQQSYYPNKYQQPGLYGSAYPQHNGANHSDHGGSINGARPTPSGTLSRNLIGSLSGSAFRLNDLDGRPGLWFVFHDLSVRTEAWFRLKFTFFDLKDNFSPEIATTAHLSKLAPMLACTYSKPFKVFSAKKFPGVIDSTPLSKCFASQGIKIPIRKEGGKDGEKASKRKREADDGDVADEEEEEDAEE